MKQIRALLADRRRAQRGSVLSGVLIMTAMIAIVAGALMTELSTNFIISSDLKIKFANQATMNSAIEASLHQLQSTPLNSGCPPLSAVNLNSTWAVPTYGSCWPTVDVRSQPFAALNGPSSAPFNVDAFRSQADGDYVLGDSRGNVFDYQFGAASPRWMLSLGGAVTGPPLVMSNGAGGYLDVIPLSGSRCLPANFCISIWDDSGVSQPSHRCEMAANVAVSTQPFASSTSRGWFYYAAGNTLVSTDATGADCDVSAVRTTTQSVIAGPIALCSSCGGGADYVFVLTSDGISNHLLAYSGIRSLSPIGGGLTVPGGNPVGMVASSSTLPSTLAITFQGGAVALVPISPSGAMGQPVSAGVGAGIAGPPYWCQATQCGSLVLAVGAQDGSLHLFDSQLNAYASSPGGGAAINTAPAADGAGDWFFASADGVVHELVLNGAQLTEVKSYGPTAQPGTSVQVGACPAGICIYLGGLDGNAYLVALDARDVVINACISTASTGCSGANPRLSARVEIGAAGDKQMVHVQGWSYYSG